MCCLKPFEDSVLHFRSIKAPQSVPMLRVSPLVSHGITFTREQHCSTVYVSGGKDYFKDVQQTMD